ncbi:hypothetical protein DdX_05382 [Ditylenchus destructor]|uniref:Uncharacterized protein n=1 Tax=Ditylenchus destructor TaxID=166010 RepID=A0AAD4R9L7_9BILA|nr:hypothetical protein DdX_05382 [Ditylenchus destructor]
MHPTPPHTQTRSLNPTPLTRSFTMLQAIFAVIFLLSVFSACEALSCYETVDGRTVIKGNYTYCALIPSTYYQGELVNGSQFGLGPENDLLHGYKAIFDTGVDEYRILSVCIYERYDFRRYLPVKPTVAVEFTFRCVCIYDLCNSSQTFSAYLSSIKTESFDNYKSDPVDDEIV